MSLPACLAHILNCLGFEGELSCMFDQRQKQTLRSSTILANKSHAFSRAVNYILPYENVDHMTFLHFHGIFANDQTHLQKQAKNRRAPPQHLLMPSLRGFPGDLKDSIPSSFLPILPSIYLKGTLKEQVVLVTSAEEFWSDTKTLWYALCLSQQMYVTVRGSDLSGSQSPAFVIMESAPERHSINELRWLKIKQTLMLCRRLWA